MNVIPSSTSANAPDLDHIENWVFDLDNTLYPPAANLFAQIDVKMGEFIQEFLGVDALEARHIQKSYFRDYGTTLNGLMQNHDMHPDIYLNYVHDIDHSVLIPDFALEEGLKGLEGRKIIFTNGSVRHAENVLLALGIAHHFDELYDIAAAEFNPKPHRETYDKFVQQTNIDPLASAMFEDMVVNLEVPHEMGMTTILVQGEGEHPDKGWITPPTGEEEFIHYVTTDLAGFLKSL